MCDTEECLEIVTTLLNTIIPNILTTCEKYVVKGGRSIDFYIHKKKQSVPLITLTDWDIICSKDTQKIIKKKIIESIDAFLKSYNIIHDIKIVTSNMTMPDGKKGIQIGIHCNESDCFLVDLIVYDDNDEIFTDNQRDDNGINYISKNYMVHDLKQTETDRLQNLDDFTVDFNLDKLNLNDTVEKNIGEIETKYKNNLQKYLDEQKKMIDDDSAKDYSIKDRLEDKTYLQKNYETSVSELYSEIIPKTKDTISKYLRTKHRLSVFKDELGKGFTRKNITPFRISNAQWKQLPSLVYSHKVGVFRDKRCKHSKKVPRKKRASRKK